MRNTTCPICGFKDYQYVQYAEEYWGIVERHGYCDRCGYMIEQAYSEPIDGFLPDIKKGYKDRQGVYHPKNTRKRARIRRKYHIKKPDNGWLLQMI